MASVIDDPNGRRRIQFTDSDGNRKAVRLGKVPRKDAEAYARHVEDLLAAKMGASPIPARTATWLAEIGDVLREKLAAVGLVESASRKCIPTLGAFLDDYLSCRGAELKASTMKVLDQASRWLQRSIAPETLLDAIYPADADRVRAELLRGRARATANKWTRYAREFFNAAVQRGLITDNPFAHLRGLAVVGDAQRRVFIPAADIHTVLDAIPCPQFRAIVALARWGGLRVPSEALTLVWPDIDLPGGRMIVRASKTAHHADRGIRIVPIFPEVRKHLEELWDLLPEGGDSRVITRYTNGTENLRTQLSRWCLSAGVKPWKKPFQNMRATRATELADQFPSHVCAAWLGHTERIADQFYRSVTDEHFLKASAGGANPAHERRQNEARTAADMKKHARTESPQVLAGVAPSSIPSDPARYCPLVQVGDTGFEPVTSSV